MAFTYIDEEPATATATAPTPRTGGFTYLDEQPATPEQRGGFTYLDEQPSTSLAATPATTERGYVSQLGHALVGGLRQAHESVKTTMGAVTGWDQATAEGAAGLATAGRMAQENLSQADVAFNQEMAANAADIEGAKGFWNKAGEWVDYAGIVARNPGAAFKTGVQSAPNALVSIPVMMGGAALGTAAGGAAGLTTGPGAVGTALAGGIAGGTAANTMLESGPAIFENVMEATQGAAKDWTTDQFKAYLSEHPEMVKAGLKSGLKRGAVIGTVDALSAGAGGKVLQMGGKGAGSAVKAGRLAGATALETASEGTGEALAGLADKGKVDSQAVVQEMIGGLATGAPSAMAGAAMIPFASETPDAAGVMTQPPGEGSTPSAGTSQVQQVQPQPTIEPKVPMTPEEVMAAKNRTGTPRPSDGTTIAHEDVDSRMVAAGLVPPEHQHIRWTEETAVAEAATMVKKDPDYAPRLVEFLAENPGVRIAPPQAVILNNHLEQANDLYEKRRDRLQSLPEGHPEREQAKTEMDAAEAAAVKAATVLDTAGSRWGSEGRARQIKRAKELFSTPAGMIAKLQAEEGRDLTAEEKEKIGLAFDREAELLKKRQKLTETQAQGPVQEVISKIQTQAKPVKATRAKKQAVLDAISTAFGGKPSAKQVSPRLTKPSKPTAKAPTRPKTELTEQEKAEVDYQKKRANAVKAAEDAERQAIREEDADQATSREQGIQYAEANVHPDDVAHPDDIQKNQETRQAEVDRRGENVFMDATMLLAASRVLTTMARQAKDLATFSRNAIARFGKWITPHVRDIWDAVKRGGTSVHDYLKGVVQAAQKTSTQGGTSGRPKFTRNDSLKAADSHQEIIQYRLTITALEQQEQDIWNRYEATQVSRESMLSGHRMEAIERDARTRQAILNSSEYAEIMSAKNSLYSAMIKKKRRIADEIYRKSKGASSSLILGYISGAIEAAKKTSQTGAIGSKSTEILGASPLDATKQGLIEYAALAVNGPVNFGQWRDVMNALYPGNPKWKPEFDAAAASYAEWLSRPTEKAAPTPAEIKASAAPGQPVPQKLVDQLVEHYVTNGETDPRRLIDSVHADLLEINPAQTVAETQNAIGHYGKPVLPDPQPMKVMQRELVALVRKIAQLRDAASGKMPWKSGVQRDNPRERLKEEQRKLRDYLIAHPELQPSDPRVQLSSPYTAVVQRLENRIVSLQAQIDKKSKARTQRSTVPDDKIIEGLRADVKRLAKELEKALENDKVYQTEQDEIWAKNAIKRLGKRVAAIDAQNKAALGGDRTAYDKKAKRERQIAKDQQDELDKIDGQLLEVQKTKAKLQHEIYLKGRTWKSGEKFAGLGVEIVTLGRELKTTLDDSGVLRQGVFALTHPIAAGRAFKESILAMRSDEAMSIIEAQIAKHPDFQLARKSKVSITDPTSHLLHKMEEAHQSRWGRSIPLISHFGRLYSTYLNVLRMGLFSELVASHRKSHGGTISEGAAKELASMTNMLTGRANFPSKYENLGTFLNVVLFAPRFLWSRFQMATGKGLIYGAKHGTRTQAAKEYGKNIAAFAGLYTIAALFGGDPEKDPRSSNFGKIKIGNTMIDPLGGLSQVAVFLAKMITGESKQDGKIVGLRKSWRLPNLVRPIMGDRPLHDKPDYGQGAAEGFTRFIRSKASPIASVVTDVVSGKPYSRDSGSTVAHIESALTGNRQVKTGDETTWRTLLESQLPMPIPAYHDLIWKSNLSPIGKVAAGAGMFFGAGVNVHEPRPIRNK